MYMNNNNSSLQYAIDLYENNYLPEAIEAFKMVDDRDAFFYLGEIYWNHETDDKDADRLALCYYEKAGEKNHAIVQLWLGNNYYLGLRSEPNYEKAFYWYQKSASNGVVYAKYRLAYMYYYGEGCCTNVELAIDLLMEASNGFLIEADFFLARLSDDKNVSVYKNVYNKYFVLNNGFVDDFIKFSKWVFTECNDEEYQLEVADMLIAKQNIDWVEKNMILSDYYLKKGTYDSINESMNLLREIADFSILAKRRLSNLERIYG